MQVILFQNIERLGMQGDVVNVAEGYYRNFLEPRGIAVKASQANLTRLDAKRKRLHSEAEKQINEASVIAKRLGELQITFKMKAIDSKKIFGSIHDHHIAEQIQAAGFTIEKRQVALHEPIKELGPHVVKIKLLGHVEAQVTVTVEPEGPIPTAGGEVAAAPPEAAPEPPAAEAAPEAEPEE